MALTTTDLARVRDEIGTAEPPSDSDLQAMSADLLAVNGVEHWLPVAIRVLKRRAAALAAGTGGATQVTIPGAIGVTLQAPSLAALQRQIDRLEAEWAAISGTPAEAGMTFGQVTRADVPR